MKKKGMLVATALAAGFLWTAPAKGQLSVGVAAGATYSSLGGELITGTDSDWGVLIGGSGLYRFQSNLGLGLEVNWVQKGGRGNVQGASWDLDLDYVEVPLTAHLIVGLGERWDWNLYGGIALAFRTTCDVAGNEGGKEPCDTGAPEFVFEDSEWSAPFGTALTYRLARSAVTADGRYSYGLSDAVDNFRLRNRSWQFILRWGFDI